MIKLTRLNGDEFVVNAEIIRFVESRPDTYLTLTSNDRLIVRESVDEVVKRSIAYSRAIRSTAIVSSRQSAVGSRQESHVARFDD